MENRELVNKFVTYLQKHGYPNLKVDYYPDEINRSTPDIDAIAGPLRIEHTSIDTIPDQRLNSDRFMKFIGNLEKELNFLPFYLGITLEYDAITTGQDWEMIRSLLKNWIFKVALCLTVVKPYTSCKVPGVPFTIYVTKETGFRGGVRFSRFPPDDDTLSIRIRDLFDKKAEKLAPYQVVGKTTVLLVENEDIALMNDWKLLNAVQKTYLEGLPSGVDEIWYADTSIKERVRFINFTPDLLVREQSKS